MDIRQCEICGQQFVAGYGYSLVVNWLVTGHAHVAAFMCDVPGGQHWGCSPEHAVAAAQKCLSEHMHAGALLAKHQATGQEERYAEADRDWAEGKGDNFHMVTLRMGRE